MFTGLEKLQTFLSENISTSTVYGWLKAIVLYSTVLYCMVPYSTVRYCTVSYCTD